MKAQHRTLLRELDHSVRDFGREKGSEPIYAPTAQYHAVGVISLAAFQGGPHPLCFST